MLRLLQFLIKILPSPFRDSLFYRSLRFLVIPKGEETHICFNAGRSLILTGVATDIISKSIYFRGYYEKKLSNLVADIGAATGTMVDVGANIGYFSVSFASYHSMNKVYAFEPSSRNLPLLEKNVKANGFESQVEVIASAVSNENGELFFENGPAEQTGWGHLSGTPTGQKVKVVALDEYFSNHDIFIDLLKIDVEGADLKVILGASNLFRRQRISTVVFECWDDFVTTSKLKDSDAGRVFCLLSESGYDMRRLEAGSYLFSCRKSG